MKNVLESHVLVTSNANKVNEARRITGTNIEHVNVDLVEPQERSCATVALAKATQAWKLLRRPLIVEDAGLEFLALGGFPGPFTKHWEQVGGLRSMCTALDGFSDRRARAVCALAVANDTGVFVIESHVDGSIARYPRGGGFGFDPIFMPTLADGMTFGELTGAGKDRFSHRAGAWRQLLASFSEGQVTRCE